MKADLYNGYTTENDLISWLQTYTEHATRETYFIWVTLTLVSISFLLICILYIRRSLITIRDKKISQLKFRYQYLIYDALVESQTEQGLTAQEIIVSKLKSEISQSNLHKQVLIDLIIDLKKNFTGNSEKQFTHLYHALSLPKYSLKKLNHHRWDVQAKGIKELAEINYNSPRTQWAITSLISAKKDVVSQEAQAASIRLRKDPLQFLQNMQYPLTEWQQINLHNILLKLDKRFIPDFTRWLSSSNTSIVIFSLRMIADFEQKDAIPMLDSTLTHKLPEVREETIRTLLHLNARQFFPQIIAASHSCGQSVVLQILETMQLWDIQDQYTFLESLQTCSSPEIQEKVTALLKNITIQHLGEASISHNV